MEGRRGEESQCSKTLVTLQLDITSQEEVDAAYERVKRDLADTDGLWGVVNNAGISTFGDVELCTMGQFHRLMEVNMFGMIRVTKAFLPLVRRARVSIVTPGNYLGATQILTADGIRHTGETMFRECSAEVREAYGGETGCREYVEGNVRTITSYLGQGVPDISPVINAYVSALTDGHPRVRYYATGAYWRIKVWAFTHLPEGVAEYIYL